MERRFRNIFMSRVERGITMNVYENDPDIDFTKDRCKSARRRKATFLKKKRLLGILGSKQYITGIYLKQGSNEEDQTFYIKSSSMKRRKLMKKLTNQRTKRLDVNIKGSIYKRLCDPWGVVD